MWTHLTSKRLRNGWDSTDPGVARLFGLDGKTWPRICVYVGPDWTGHGCIVHCNKKLRSGCWWESASIPLDVLQALPSMIAEYIATLEPVT